MLRQDIRSQSMNWVIDSLEPSDAPSVWVVDLDCLTSLPVSTMEEREQAEFYSETLWAHRFLVRRAAIRKVSADLSGVPAGDIRVERGPTGALKYVPPIPGLNASMSHRGPYAAMAFGSAPIGVDLESTGDFVQIPWNVLHPAEVKALEALDDDQRTLGFLRLWTVKEAYVKALGFGLSREPASFAALEREGSIMIDDPLTVDRPPIISTRMISSLGPQDIVVSCVTFR